MSVLLTSAYMRTFLLVLMNGYFLFVLVAYLYDRALSEYCDRANLPKPARFIFGSSVKPYQLNDMLATLKPLPAPAGSYALWLRVWLFTSEVFFLLVMIFMGLAIASLATHQI